MATDTAVVPACHLAEVLALILLMCESGMRAQLREALLVLLLGIEPLHGIEPLLEASEQALGHGREGVPLGQGPADDGRPRLSARSPDQEAGQKNDPDERLQDRGSYEAGDITAQQNAEWEDLLRDPWDSASCDRYLRARPEKL